jgi:hypothetical protein
VHTSGTNVGASRNYNRTFRLARGEYFKWIAADDVLAPTFLERCVEALDSDGKLVLAYPRARCIDEGGNMFLDADEGGHVDWQRDPAGRFRQLVEGNLWRMLFVFGLMRTDALRRTRLMGSFVGADGNFLAELALEGMFHEVPERLSFLRLHPGSSTWHQNRRSQLHTFFDPSSGGSVRVWLSNRRRYIEYFVSIVRARITPREKLSLVAFNATRPLRRLSERLNRITGRRS